jgi:hypothetical protein
MFSNGRNHYIYKLRNNILNRYEINILDKN